MPEPAETIPIAVAAIQESTMPNTQPTAEADRAAASQVAAAAAEATRAERERIAAFAPIVVIGRTLLPGGSVDTRHQRAIADGWAPEALRGALFEALGQGARSTPAILPANPAAGPAQDDPAVILEAMAEALAVRAMPGYQAPAGSSGRHVEFLGWRPTEMVAELMRARGERNIPRGAAKLADRAFHTTSDFPLLL